MAEYSSVLLEKAVDELSKLPGVGKKTALRLALHLLGEGDRAVDTGVADDEEQHCIMQALLQHQR